MTTEPQPSKKLSKARQYHTTEWKQFRTSIFERDNYTCVKCGAQGVELNAHHTKYGKGMIWDCPMEWCITVCEKCHSKIHGRRMGRSLSNKKAKVNLLDLM